MENHHKTLVLASTSPYRAELLKRLQLAFSQHGANIDESRIAGETPAELALRLSIEKARALESQYPQSLIIGSDQVAELEGEILGKPGTVDKACQQLAACSSKTVIFHTGVCLLDSSDGSFQADVSRFEVHFRPLTSDEIRTYVEKDQPLDCAGSFKMESLGISLFESATGDDPTSIIGLPLIKLSTFLRCKSATYQSYLT